MSGILGIMEIGRRALNAQQVALNTTGHNIANANTEGFTRQEAVLKSAQPLKLLFGHVGTGVDVTEIRRFRDQFIDSQIREEKRGLGSATYKRTGFEEIETILNEPSESGLRSMLARFFNSFQELANNPESTAVRNTVRDQANVLASAFNQSDKQLRELQESFNNDLELKVGQINSILKQIANLNNQIASVKGEASNDFLDKRDLLVDQFNELAEVTIFEEENGIITVSIKGITLISGEQVFELETKPFLSGSSSVLKVIRKDEGDDVEITEGKIAGLLEMRDEIVPKYRGFLDQLASALIEEVNTIHQSGFGLSGSSGVIPSNNKFFSGTGASDITLDPDIVENTNNMAASSDGSPGDNGVALAIAQLSRELILDNNTETIGDFYNSVIGTLGIEVQEINNLAENQELLITRLENIRQSISGVSLDEELTNLIEFQHAYQAAARLITLARDMMDTVLQMV